MRGRGRGFGMGFGMGGPPPPPRMPPPGFRSGFIPRVPFDSFLCEQVFPKVKLPEEDSDLNELIVKRNAELAPTSQEETAVQKLATNVQTIIEGLKAKGFELCVVDEVKPVGPFKESTMITGHIVAELVVILKALPTKEAVEAMSKKVHQEIKSQLSPLDKLVQNCQADKGLFEIISSVCAVRVYVTSIHQNLRSGEHEIDIKILRSHLSLIRHWRWFEENGKHDFVKTLIRLTRDLTLRFDGFSSLSPWMANLLVHYVVMNTPTRTPLQMDAAYRRIFQVLAAGLFLPGSASIIDPCEPNGIRVHMQLSLEQQDAVCLTAQTLLRVLAHGGYKQILYGNPSIATDMSVWDGVIVSPLDKAYEASDEDGETEADDQVKVKMETE